MLETLTRSTQMSMKHALTGNIGTNDSRRKDDDDVDENDDDKRKQMK